MAKCQSQIGPRTQQAATIWLLVLHHSCMQEWHARMGQVFAKVRMYLPIRWFSIRGVECWNAHLRGLLEWLGSQL